MRNSILVGCSLVLLCLTGCFGTGSTTRMNEGLSELRPVPPAPADMELSPEFQEWIKEGLVQRPEETKQLLRNIESNKAVLRKIRTQNIDHNMQIIQNLGLTPEKLGWIRETLGNKGE